MDIRIARKDDSEKIGKLHAESWRSAYKNVLSEEYLSGNIVSERTNFWNNRLSNPDSNLRVVVASVDQEIVGFACFVLERDSTWGTLLDNLHVVPTLKRGKIGTLLMVEVARICIEQANHQGLYLWVLESNENAQRFYKSLGANHTESDIWFPPGGGQVPKFRYAWSSVQDIRNTPGGN